MYRRDCIKVCITYLLINVQKLRNIQIIHFVSDDNIIKIIILKSKLV